MSRRWSLKSWGNSQGKGVSEPDASPACLQSPGQELGPGQSKENRQDTGLGATGGWAYRWTNRQQERKTGPWSLCLTEAASLAAVSPGSWAPAAGWVPPATSEASVGCNINAGMGSDTGRGTTTRTSTQVASRVGQSLHSTVSSRRKSRVLGMGNSWRRC